jgi:hypothetical protein
MNLHLMAYFVQQACREIGAAWQREQQRLQYLEETKGAHRG